MSKSSNKNLELLELAMENIKSLLIKDEEIEGLLTSFLDRVGDGRYIFTYSGELILVFIKFLEKLFNDDSEWISWFIWENDFGKNNFTIELNNKEYAISNTKDLWEYILKEKNE